MRRLQQKQAEQAAAKNPGPEKLTFKEKMKMFAMETGEAETPKDKVKISRAQRDIEHWRQKGKKETVETLHLGPVR